ncbi:hypothetical protein TNCV_2518641 [Trichonephila clavipes]|nr:hypothetical protein TNCV_2518641 [Trichonephila clavipes]
MGVSLQHLLRYKDDGDDFVQHIAAEDKTWCHHFQPSACKGNFPTHIGSKNSKLISQPERSDMGYKKDLIRNHMIALQDQKCLLHVVVDVEQEFDFIERDFSKLPT